MNEIVHESYFCRFLHPNRVLLALQPNSTLQPLDKYLKASLLELPSFLEAQIN